MITTRRVAGSTPAVFMTSLCVIVHVLTLGTSVDGFLIPHRKNEIPGDLSERQLENLLKPHSSKSLSELKNAKKGM
jgi:hypothetical protein